MYRQLVKPERLRYKDAKAVITHIGPDGNPLSTLTTWRADSIECILRGGDRLNQVSAGDKVTILIEIDSMSGPDKSEEVPVSLKKRITNWILRRTPE